MTSIVVTGAAGRMGARVCALAGEGAGFELRACVECEAAVRAGAPGARGAGAPALQTAKSLEKSGVFSDVVIDFSTDEGARDALALAERLRAALLVGTTLQGLIGATGAAVLYFELRRTKEGVGVEALASIFD